MIQYPLTDNAQDKTLRTLLLRGDKEIEAGKGSELEAVMAGAAKILEGDKR